MHLGDRGAGHRVALETGEYLGYGSAVGFVQDLFRLFAREGRHAILEPGQFVGDIRRHQVAARRQHLAEFDEYGAQRFQRATQPLGARRGEVAPEQQGGNGGTQHAHAFMTEQEFVESEAQGDAQDFQQAEEAHPRILTGCRGPAPPQFSGGRAVRCVSPAGQGRRAGGQPRR